MYSITQQDIESITDYEAIRGTNRLLPAVEDIPPTFWGWYKGHDNNIYMRIVLAMDVGEPAPPGQITLNPGFSGVGVKRCMQAHLNHINTEFQHRCAGMAFMLSKIMTIIE